MVTIDGARLPRPTATNRQISLSRALQHIAIIIQQLRLDAKKRFAGTARPHGMGVGQGGYHHAAGFCLPPCIYDGHIFFANNTVIPTPCLWINRLTHRAQQADGGQVMLFNRCVTLPHQGADCGWRGVKDIDLMPFAHIPKTTEIRIVGNTLKHKLSRAVEQRAINDIAMPCDPANIGRAPEYLSILIIKCVVESCCRPNSIAATCV